ncbi:MAG: AIM24 family protein, partial [Spirochaetales bacterium]|nr:AIM24 family protein [Spirochaetales bacterium]
MKHEIDYEIIGDDMQIIEIELDQHETVIAEAGVMNYMDEGIGFETKMGDGSSPGAGFLEKALGAGKRLLTGESLFMTHFTNHAPERQIVAFAAPYPGKIMAIDLKGCGGEFICQKDAFLCAAMGTKIEITFSRRLATGLFGGEGFILQKLTGDGKAFIHVGGTVVKKELKGEKILVDTGCLAGFSTGIRYDV